MKNNYMSMSYIFHSYHRWYLQHVLDKPVSYGPEAGSSKGLRRHVMGTARKPVDLVERNGHFYKPNILAAKSRHPFERSFIGPSTNRRSFRWRMRRMLLLTQLQNSRYVEGDSMREHRQILRVVYSHIDLPCTKFPIPINNLKCFRPRVWKETCQ